MKTHRVRDLVKKAIVKLMVWVMAIVQIAPLYAPKDSLYYPQSLVSGFSSMADVSLDDVSGKVYVADSAGSAIHSVDTAIIPPISTQIMDFSSTPSVSNPSAVVYHNGAIYTSQGTSVVPYTHSGGSWQSGTPITGFSSAQGIAFDSDGNMYVADSAENRILKVSASTTLANVLAGGGSDYSGYNDATGTDALFSNPQGITCDNLGHLYVVDTGNNLIRKINIATGAVTTFAGNPALVLNFLPAGFADGAGSASAFSNPEKSTIDAYGNVFVTGKDNKAIRKITPSGYVSTIAQRWFRLSDAAPSAITMNRTTGVFYIGDSNNGSLIQMLPNYFGPGVEDRVLHNFDYGTESINFAGGVMTLTGDVTLSNPINLLATSLINTNGYTLTLTGACTGTASLISFDKSGVNFPSGNSQVISSNAINIENITTSYIFPPAPTVPATPPPNALLIEGNSSTSGTLTVRSTPSSDDPLAAIPIYFVSGSAPILQFGDDSHLYNPITLLANGVIDANGKTPSLYGALGGSGGMTFKSTGSAGTITMNTTPATYTGSTVIGANTTTTLLCNMANAISSSSGVMVASGGTFDVDGYLQTVNNLSGSGTITDSNTSGGGQGSLTINMLTSETFSGAFDSSIGAVTVTGSGVLALTGANSSWAGNLTIQNGILNIANAAAIGTGTLTFNNGILQAGGALTFPAIKINLAGNAIIDTKGNSIDLSACNITAVDSFGNPLADSSGIPFSDITIIGGGTVKFPSDYTGSVTAITGTPTGATALEVADGSPFSPSASNSYIQRSSTSSGTLTNGTIIIQDGNYDISSSSGNNIYFDALPSGSPHPTLQARANFTQATPLSNPIFLVTPGIIDLNGNSVVSTGVISGNNGLTVRNSSGTAGTLSLLSSNSYTGGTTIQSGATVNIADASALGIGLVTLGGTLQAAGNLVLSQAFSLTSEVCTLDTYGYAVTLLGSFSGNYPLNIIDSSGTGKGILKVLSGSNLGTGYITQDGGVTLQALADLSLTNNFTLNANSTIDTNGYAVTTSGGISGNHQLTVKDNSLGALGSFTPSGTNSGSGTTVVNSGSLKIAASRNLGSGSISMDGGILQALGAFSLSQAIILGENTTIDTKGHSLVLGAIALVHYNLSVINGGAITNGNITASGSTVPQLKVSGGCVWNFGGTYTDTDSTPDAIEVIGNGTTVVAPANSSNAPPIYELGNGTVLRASGGILGSIVCS
jgi:autotransporter-associated beta strand protein